MVEIVEGALKVLKRMVGITALRHPGADLEVAQCRDGTRSANDRPTRPVGVALLGIDQRLQNTLRLFFQTSCRNRYFIEADEGDANLSIIDLDSQQGRTLWASHAERYPARPTILLSLTKIDVGGATLVSKPLQAKMLQSVLDRAWEQLSLQSPGEAAKSNKLPESQPRTGVAETVAPTPQRKVAEPGATQIRPQQQKVRSKPISHNAGMQLDEKEFHAFIGTAPDIDLQDSQQVQKAQYDPQRFLVGQVLHASRLAEEKNRPVRLVNHRGSLTFMPDGKKVLVDMQKRHLHSLCALPIGYEGTSVSVLKSELAPEPGSQESWHDLDVFVWNLTLNTCRGRMPLGTDPMAPVVLRHWPNLTRLHTMPHAQRIAALWMHKPTSLSDTAKVLDIRQRCVFSFYSAAHALGLATTTARYQESTPARPQSLPQHGRRGLLRRVLKHLQFRPRASLQQT